MVLFFDDSDVLVDSEDGASQQERLRHVVEQPVGHVVDVDHLIGYECDAAHDKQHRTSILRDFEAFVFHGVLHEGGFACCAEDGGNDVTQDLEYFPNCLVHGFACFLMVNN